MDIRVNRSELQISESGTTRFFTLEQANRTLVLVQKVASDIMRLYARLCDVRADAGREGTKSCASSPCDAADHEERQLIESLTALQDELRGIGCELKDWATGLVDFPCLMDGRRVWLCWKPGETAVTHWHEWNEGFTGRKPVSERLPSGL